MARVLVIGDSQAQATGARVRELLAAGGHKAELVATPGASTKAIAAKLLPLAKAGHDRVVVFAGGNDGKIPADTVAQVVTAFRGRLVWVGPPPATPIADLATARKAFGQQVATALHWYQPQGSSSASRAEVRERNAAELHALLDGVALYVDPRRAGLGGQKLPAVAGKVRKFPWQPDGIHLVGAGSKTLAEQVTAAVLAPDLLRDGPKAMAARGAQLGSGVAPVLAGVGIAFGAALVLTWAARRFGFI